MLNFPEDYKIDENEEINIDSFVGREYYILPDKPSNYSKIKINDIGNKLEINPCTIKCNGHFINGKQNDLILKKNGIRIILQYNTNIGYTIY